jgi:prepilin-type processing-associated H-X9-DG protein
MPLGHVSLAMNARLYRGVTTNEAGVQVLADKENTTITSRVIDRPYVPLIFDVDASQAASQGVTPFYSAPPVADDDPYASGKYWNPSDRHRGRTNVAFVGGHVLASQNPGKESWDWKYQAETKRRHNR